jgi:cell division septum initiation protein DivIVA
MKSSRDAFLDQVALRLQTMSTLNEEVTQLKDQVTAVTKSVPSLRHDIQSAQDRNKLFALKLSRSSMLSAELTTLMQSWEDLNPGMPGKRARLRLKKLTKVCSGSQNGD